MQFKKILGVRHPQNRGEKNGKIGFSSFCWFTFVWNGHGILEAEFSNTGLAIGYRQARGGLELSVLFVMARTFAYWPHSDLEGH